MKLKFISEKYNHLVYCKYIFWFSICYKPLWFFKKLIPNWLLIPNRLHIYFYLFRWPLMLRYVIIRIKSFNQMHASANGFKKRFKKDVKRVVYSLYAFNYIICYSKPCPSKLHEEELAPYFKLSLIVLGFIFTSLCCISVSLSGMMV